MSVNAVAVPPPDGRKILPRGWGDLVLQIGIWFGFLAAYQVARGVADRNAATAFENGLKVIDLESRANSLFELSLQGLVESSQLLAVVTSWTYWLSQFTVLGLALLWVYLRRNEIFSRREWDLKTPLRAGASDEELTAVLRNAVAHKELKHRINEPGFVRASRSMNQIGG